MEKSITVTRIFDAAPHDAWKLWSESENVMKWWGPDHFTCPLARMDFREGGVSLVSMKYPKEMGEQTSYSIWSYTIIIPFKRIEYIQNLSDKNGIKQNPVSLDMPPDFPVDVRTVVEFNPLKNGKTEVVMTEYADFGQMTHFAISGLEQCMDKAKLILMN